MKKKILSFINKQREGYPIGAFEDIFTRGQCYWFAVVLYERFHPFYTTKIVYNPIENHFAVSIQNTIYDATGIIGTYPSDNWFEWAQYIKTEPTESSRIYRDCIWQIDPDDFSHLPTSYQKHPWTLSNII